MSNKCASCEMELPKALPVGHEEEVPVEGDILLCSFCYELNVYNKDLQLVKPSEEFINSMPDWFKAQIDEFKEKMKKKNGPDPGLN